jgi:hypothetical protein
MMIVTSRPKMCASPDGMTRLNANPKTRTETIHAVFRVAGEVLAAALVEREPRARSVHIISATIA